MAEYTSRSTMPAGSAANGLAAPDSVAAGAPPRSRPTLTIRPDLPQSTLKRRRRRLLVTTVTLERPMAAAA